MQQKIYPSSFALPVGPTTDTQYKNGCFRYLKFKSYLPEHFKKFDPMPELNSAIGVIGEERIRHLLLDRYSAEELLIEEPFKQDLGDDVIVSGRCDFLIKTADLIVEVKSTKSASVRSKVINKGELPTSYLGQLLTYMTAFDIAQGEILVQYLHLLRDASSLGFVDRTFKVKIDDNSIYIDGVEYEHTLSHMLSFYELAKKYLTTDVMPPRPIKDTPCYYCPFESICNSATPPTTTQEFKEKVGQLTPDYSKKFGPPKLPRHNIRKKG